MPDQRYDLAPVCTLELVAIQLRRVLRSQRCFLVCPLPRKSCGEASPEPAGTRERGALPEAIRATSRPGFAMRTGKFYQCLTDPTPGLVFTEVEVTCSMSRWHFSALPLAFAISATVGIAQSPRPMPLGPGDAFPEMEVYDAAGEPFDTKSLTGQYTVVVNGCLT